MENIKQIVKILKRLKFPAKPTKKQLLLYKEAVYKTCVLQKQPEVLILGATPELRDLCIKHNCKVTAVSPGKIALEAMTYMMEHKDHPNNKAIESNWTNIPLPNNSCDLALTDMALTCNPIKKHDPILKEVQRILKPSGFFFIRSYDMLEHESKLDPDELLKQWRTREIVTEDFIYLSPRISLDENNNISQAKNLEIFKQFCQEKKLTKKEIAILIPYKSKGTMSCPYRKDLIKTFSKYFKNITVKCAKDPKIKTIEQDALFFMQVKKF